MWYCTTNVWGKNQLVLCDKAPQAAVSTGSRNTVHPAQKLIVSTEEHKLNLAMQVQRGISGPSYTEALDRQGKLKDEQHYLKGALLLVKPTTSNLSATWKEPLLPSMSTGKNTSFVGNHVHQSLEVKQRDIQVFSTHSKPIFAPSLLSPPLNHPPYPHHPAPYNHPLPPYPYCSQKILMLFVIQSSWSLKNTVGRGSCNRDEVQESTSDVLRLPQNIRQQCCDKQTN